MVQNVIQKGDETVSSETNTGEKIDFNQEIGNRILNYRASIKSDCFSKLWFFQFNSKI